MVIEASLWRRSQKRRKARLQVTISCSDTSFVHLPQGTWVFAQVPFFLPWNLIHKRHKKTQKGTKSASKR